MFRSPFAAVLFATAGVLISHAQARADAVDDYVNAEIQKRNIPGLSLAVVRDAKVVKAAAYGKANVELDVPVTTDTVFQIQSITKTFTSAAILSLVEEGRIALNDPISKYLDGTPDTWKEITIRHLLSHTSGIKDFINEPTASIRLDASEEEVLKATARARSTSSPATSTPTATPTITSSPWSSASSPESITATSSRTASSNPWA